MVAAGSQEAHGDVHRKRDHDDRQPQQAPALHSGRATESYEQRHSGGDETGTGQEARDVANDSERVVETGREHRERVGHRVQRRLGGVRRHQAEGEPQGAGRNRGRRDPAPPHRQRPAGRRQVQNERDEHEPRDEQRFAEDDGEIGRRQRVVTDDGAVRAVAVQQSGQGDTRALGEEQPADRMLWPPDREDRPDDQGAPECGKERHGVEAESRQIGSLRVGDQQIEDERRDIRGDGERAGRADHDHSRPASHHVASTHRWSHHEACLASGLARSQIPASARTRSTGAGADSRCRSTDRPYWKEHRHDRH